jgi:hypothetical protein
MPKSKETVTLNAVSPKLSNGKRLLLYVGLQNENASLKKFN